MSTSLKPASTGPLTKKRLDLRSPSKKHKKPAIARPTWIVGRDFLAALPDAQRLLAKAMEPGKAGRPRRMQKNWGVTAPSGRAG